MLNNTTDRISIIILNWNGLNDTLECLESVKEINHPNFEVIVVDNGSTDGSPAEIRKQFPDVTVLETGKNLGFAEGNNIGIRYAIKNGAEYILILNNDTVVDSELLNAFVQASQIAPDAGILGPKIYYYSIPDVIWGIGARWSCEHLDFSIVGNNQIDDRDEFDAITPFDALIGCSMFIKAEVFKRIGYFHPDFFLCWEEYDFCSRAIKAGYSCLFIPHAKIWHKIGATLGAIESPLRTYFNSRNRLLWTKRNLTLKERLTIYKKLYNDLSPKLNIDYSEIFWQPKKIYWALLEYKKQFQKRYKSPNYKAELWGVIDYFFCRFGNCPDHVLHLKTVQNNPLEYGHKK